MTRSRTSAWPDNIQCAVLLTFDLDAESSWLARDPDNDKRPVLLSQARFGPKVAVPEIIDLLGSFGGLPATFFIPALVVERYPKAVEQVRAAGYEVGAHGDVHENVETLTPGAEEAILAKSVAVLERATGVRPVGYRSPFGEISAVTFELLERYGFDYSSNMMDDLVPYLHPSATGAPPLVELPFHWVLDDAPFFQFGQIGRTGVNRPIQPAGHVLSIWKEEFAGIYERGGLFNLVMHPQLIGRPSRIRMLGELIAYMRTFPGVWFARAGEVSRHWRKHSDTTA
jgi:peptidoglycan/xylan/chitin deacetylase (PgdA/CDA1 family)